VFADRLGLASLKEIIMLAGLATTSRHAIFGTLAAIFAALAIPAAAQQIETVDPDLMIDGDLAGESRAVPPPPAYGEPASRYSELPASDASTYEPNYDQGDYLPGVGEPALPVDPSAMPVSRDEPAPSTYAKDDLIGEAEGLFGKGAEGLARLIEGILKEQGEPNGYIVGREAGGAFVVGLRYGSGTLHHKIEGNMPVYWTGPSIGFDAGANAGNTFVLVYNLHDTEQLYERYPSGEGQAYFVGGFNASYLRKGGVVLIPIRVGAGLRLGVNAGYMKFSKEQRWLPF